MDKRQEKYMKGLEDVARKILAPASHLPYSTIISLMSGHEVLPFDKDNPANKAFMELLKEVVDNSIGDAHDKVCLSRHGKVSSKIRTRRRKKIRYSHSIIISRKH